MASYLMKPPTTLQVLIDQAGTVINPDSNGNFTVDVSQYAALKNAGWTLVNPNPGGVYQTQYKSITTDGNSANNAILSIGAANIAGAQKCVFSHGGNQGANWTDRIPDAATLIAAVPGWQIGQSFELRVINKSLTANRTLTIAAANNNVTLTGTMTLAQNVTRDFLVSYNAANAVVIQEIGTGTES